MARDHHRIPRLVTSSKWPSLIVIGARARWLELMSTPFNAFDVTRAPSKRLAAAAQGAGKD
jgi:hypothetical protein